ncbi:type VII secretion protein EccCa [Cellulomonas sp. H30R-01]|uniref:type VII secretion protein EccCa n=1 Tax=Cellulomonas sp. H30R-01 TaxID=2704467 RepID=UPI00138CC008|nr:type VII secretion protein EccCa [Cellulomonas sp. H30R-01]QHT57426.1 type VII secretion protein EccCa [Cellulomonas sp. H30R-01]
MTRLLVHRPARMVRPLEQPPDVPVASPPQTNDATGGAGLQSLLPVVGAVGSMTMMLVLRGNPLFVLVGIMVLVVALVGGVGMALSSRGTAARTRRLQRERYLDYLEELRADLADAEDDARSTALTVHPDPVALVDVVRDPERRWERRRTDPDFLDLRVGVGDRPWFSLVVPEDPNPTQPFDPAMAAEARTVATRHARVPQMPVTVRLDRAGEVAVVGPRDAGLAVVRALVTQAVALHAPDDLQVAAAFPAARAGDWAWLGAVPHVVDDTLFDGPVAARRVAGDLAGLVRVVGPTLVDRAQAAARARRGGGMGDGAAFAARLLVLSDDHGDVAQVLPAVDAALRPADLGVTVVHLVEDRRHEPSDTAVRLTVDADGSVVVEDLRDPDAVPVRATVDDVPVPLASGLTRALTPLRLSWEDSAEAGEAAAIGTDALLGVEDVRRIDLRRTWAPRSSRDFLRVPVGVDDTGTPLLLDLKESAQLGMGPHGLCVGATGSGKSEMLRTLVAALAITHPPDDLAMILVDYKGGAAFAPFADLPHVAGIIDNLADDAGLTERARASIAGEVVRRQQVLRDAGSSPSITHYREMRATTRPDLPPLPHLLLVIDEFGELLTADPDFVDLLLTIGRIGRSIGMHLLLSSQRIESGRLRGLETYLSYRIGLRTFSEAESSVVLDTPDAFHLPAVPGYGYLKVDTTVYQRFRAGYVSGPLPTDDVPEPEVTDETRRPLLVPVHHGVLAANGLGDGAPGEVELVRPSVGASMVDVVVEQLASAADATTPVWLPPLPARVALGGLVGEQRPPHLTVPVGVRDDPAKQRQETWRLDLTRAGGHVAIIGAPQSGRTTVLWTIAAGLALTHDPRQVAVYGMDLAGGGLSRLEAFPHVGGVATRSSRDRLRRLLEELHGMLAHREKVFAEHGIDSLALLRARHAAGQVPELATADVVLLVDGVGAVRGDFEELDETFTALLSRGSGFGIHVVMTMARWNEVRMQSQPLVGTRVELRLNDPGDSTVGRKLAATLRADQPGRALTDDGLFAQVALPLPDTAALDGDVATVGAGLDALADEARRRWGGAAAAPKIRELPEVLELSSLPDPLDEPDLVPFGLRQDTMSPALLDLVSRDQHLLVFGDPRCGKTTLLRTVVEGLVDRSTPDELVVAVFDPRGGLADVCPEDYLGGRATSAPLALQLSTAVAAELAKRTGDGPSGGPRIVVVVDDYDILASGGTDPLRPLLEHLPAARDLRLHVLLTRPVAGASRALYDPVLQAVRDTGGSGFLMAGERSEGQVFPGQYAELLPPGRGKWLRRGERPTLVQVATSQEVPGAP